MKTVFSVLAIFLCSLTQAQDRTVSIQPYSSLVVSRGVDVRLVHSDSREAKVQLNGVDPDNLIIENHGHELEIKVSTKSLWEEMQDHHWWVRIELPYQELDFIEVLSGAKVSSKEVFKARMLEVEANIGGELELVVDLEELSVDASMGAMVELEGRAEDIDISASMGAEVDMRDLESKTAYAKSSMGSEVRMQVRDEFDGRANMGGFIRVYGNPPKFYESTSMGGEIVGSN